MSEDHALVQDILAGRTERFAELVQRQQKLVWHLVYRLVGHPDDARELCQDVFLRVYRCLHQFRADSSLATWIGRIAYSIAARHLQKRRIALTSIDADSDDEGRVRESGHEADFDLQAAHADAEIMAHVSAAIECLPPLQRTLVSLYHLEELGVAEIAQITELPVGTVKNYLFRARRTLKAQLEKRLGELA